MSQPRLTSTLSRGRRVGRLNLPRPVVIRLDAPLHTAFTPCVLCFQTIVQNVE